MCFCIENVELLQGWAATGGLDLVHKEAFNLPGRKGCPALKENEEYGYAKAQVGSVRVEGSLERKN